MSTASEGDSILLVEDDSDVRQLLGNQLARLGYRVSPASTIGECVARLRTGSPAPDLLLMDRFLPDGDAIEVLQDMTPAGPLPRIPVVMISVDASAEGVSAALAAGAIDYLVKPFESKVLSARLAAVIREARQKETLLKTQQVLARVKRELELIFDAVAEGVMLLDAEMRIRRINRSGMIMAGKVSYEQVLGLKCSDVKGCGAGSCEGCPAAAALRSGRSREAEMQRTIAGRAAIVHIQAHYLEKGDAGNGMAVVVADDITARREGEQERMRAEKLEAVMRLAGGLAHEISQPLAAVSGRAELLEMALGGSDKGDDRSEIARHVENLRSSSRRLSDIVHRLQNISDYITKPYYGQTEIFDLERSSQPKEEEQAGGDSKEREAV